MAVARCRTAALQRAVLGLPFWQSAIEHGHIIVAEMAEHPPGPGRAEQTHAVIDDDAHAVAEAEPAHPRGKLLRARQHMGQGVARIGDLVDVEIDRARNVRLGVFGLCVALHRRKVPGPIDHMNVGRGKVLGKPLGAYQRVRIGVVQPSSSSIVVSYCRLNRRKRSPATRARRALFPSGMRD